MQAHTARAAVGVETREPVRRNWTLSRKEAVPKLPRERGASCRTHMVVAAPQACSCSTAPAAMDDWGEPVSNRATMLHRVVAVGPLCTFILVVHEESSTVRMSLWRHGPCSGIGWCGARG